MGKAATLVREPLSSTPSGVPCAQCATQHRLFSEHVWPSGLMMSEHGKGFGAVEDLCSKFRLNTSLRPSLLDSSCLAFSVQLL